MTMLRQQVPRLLLLLLLAAASVLSDDCPEQIFDHATNSEGGTAIPVFHRNHPCLRRRRTLLLGAKKSAGGGQKIISTDVIEDSSVNNRIFLIPIKLGSPPVTNLVAFDTGSSLSWVQCQPCTVQCHNQSEKAGPIFDPKMSSTSMRVRCFSTECRDIKHTLGLTEFDNCMEIEGSCLYSMSYGDGSTYSVGKVIIDNLRIGEDSSSRIIIRLMFGCSLDVQYSALGSSSEEAGVVGFGTSSFSFFEQVAAASREMMNYKAFSYCLPSNESTNKGYLVLGDYNRETRVDDAITALFPSSSGRATYSLMMDRLVVDGDGEKFLLVTSPLEMIVDSGARWTFLPPAIFDRLKKVITPKLSPLGYFPSDDERGSEFICFLTQDDKNNWNARARDFSNWSSLPVVEMGFIGATPALTLPPHNSFHLDSRYGLCMNFVKNSSPSMPLVLGNRVMRSFRTVFDIQGKKFRFQHGAC
ncbi:hypothetical protein QOZ80_5BG0409550 [Eleusine coracana subsp. coracana]|nr:hypothetical protein QOZ80_5BG0409550 [Eleusine coracana subsp. coracana]